MTHLICTCFAVLRRDFCSKEVDTLTHRFWVVEEALQLQKKTYCSPFDQTRENVQIYGPSAWAILKKKWIKRIVIKAMDK